MLPEKITETLSPIKFIINQHTVIIKRSTVQQNYKWRDVHPNIDEILP